jgi:hypothetical protein
MRKALQELGLAEAAAAASRPWEVMRQKQNSQADLVMLWNCQDAPVSRYAVAGVVGPLVYRHWT